MTLRAPPTFPQAVEDDADDVAWALRTAGVQWNRGARADAIEWLLRAVEMSIDTGRIERAREIQRNINELDSAQRAESAAPPATNGEPASPLRRKPSSLPPLPPPPGYESLDEPLELDVDVDVELEDEIETIEVLEPEVIDEVASEELDVLEVEQLTDAPPDVDPGSIPAAALPSFPPDELPTAQAPASQQFAPLPASGPPPLPTAAPAAATPSIDAPAESSASRPAASPSVPIHEASAEPSDAPTREPWPPSPSFGDNLGPFSENLVPPPASVVFRAASAVPAIDESLAEPPPLPGAAPLPAEAGPAAIHGIELSEVRGLEDLPDEAQHQLVRAVELHELDADEEISGFGLALVLDGVVAVMPAVMDVVCVQAARGELIFAEGHVEDGVALKVVAAAPGTRVATWPIAEFADAIAPCPWVRDELRGVGDRLQAMVGAAMGRMGELLDEQLRALVLERCTVKLLLPGDVAAEANKPLTGMTIVGAGRLELEDPSGAPLGHDAALGPGDFLFPAEMLRAAPAPATARAGRAGALIVFTDRKTAHELLMSVPPLIEVLSD